MNLIREIGLACDAARRVPTRRVNDIILDGARRSVAHSAERAGLVKEGTAAERGVDAIAAEGGRYLNAEEKLKALMPGLKSSRGLVSSVVRPPDGQLERIFAEFSSRERFELRQMALRLTEGKSIPEALLRENNMAGALREVVAKYLDAVVEEVVPAVFALRLHTRGSSTESLVDSATHGAVELPTAMKPGGPFIRLGTDRIVGRGVVSPHPIEVTWSDGTKGLLDVAGILDVSVAVEVKGRTTATGGIAQLRALSERAKAGYAIIGKQLWLLKYDASRVTHILVAPEGREFAAAAIQAATDTERGRKTIAVSIDLRTDEKIKELAKAYLMLTAASRH